MIQSPIQGVISISTTGTVKWPLSSFIIFLSFCPPAVLEPITALNTAPLVVHYCLIIIDLLAHWQPIKSMLPSCCFFVLHKLLQNPNRQGD